MPAAPSDLAASYPFAHLEIVVRNLDASPQHLAAVALEYVIVIAEKEKVVVTRFEDAGSQMPSLMGQLAVNFEGSRKVMIVGEAVWKDLRNVGACHIGHRGLCCRHVVGMLRTRGRGHLHLDPATI
jgi:hypothetical protein